MIQRFEHPVSGIHFEVLKLGFVAITMLSIMSCEPNYNENIMWVNSARVDCVGVGPMQCYQVKQSEKEPWGNFYQEISGFEFEPGFVYKLKVRIDTLDRETLPADKSSLEYHLIEVISKQTDPYSSLNDIWVVTEIPGIEPDSLKTVSVPNLEINTRSMQVMGTDGCNQYRGVIELLSADQLLFGPIMSTRKGCPDMSIPNEYTAALSQVAYFKKEGLELVLLDRNKAQLLSFKKVD